uniref:Uncharacterized protein n=1 Tax=Panagrolaimus davidi TaxID=227884 RepID=A0A914Q3P6_9BILA
MFYVLFRSLIAKSTTKKPSPGDPDKSSDPKDKASLPLSHQEEPALTPASNTSKENQSLPVKQPLLPEVRPQPPQTSVSSVAANVKPVSIEKKKEGGSSQRRNAAKSSSKRPHRSRSTSKTE